MAGALRVGSPRRPRNRVAHRAEHAPPSCSPVPAAIAVALFAVLALASVGVVLVERDADVQAAGHGDCDACHLRHVQGVATNGPPATPAPDLVAHAVVSTHPDGERSVALGILSTRGPPA